MFALTSDLHDEVMPSASQEAFIKSIEAALGRQFDCRESDFSSLGSAPGREYIYVRTGGTEGIFRRMFRGNGPVRLIAGGQSNSLAASMEILSWLRQQGIKGEILHGTPSEIAAAIDSPSHSPEGSGRTRELKGNAGLLDGVRLGVVGRPSDWLISSDVDYARAKRILGVEIVDIPMEELLREIGKGGYVLPDGIGLQELNEPKYGKPFVREDWEKALDIYGALDRIVDRYALRGLSLRCFDLLGAVGNTGCLALAILNARGITATCEGDVPAMLTMAVANRIAGTSGFQVNLSRVSGDELLFAHCTVPLDIVESYCYDRHFESGIGVAVHGEFRPGPVTLFKIAADLRSFVAEEAMLEANSYGKNLCRTQVLLKAEGLGDYFLHDTLGNHHVIVPGRHAAQIRKSLGE